MASDSITGKAGKTLVAGTAATITKWSAKVKKEMAKSTDSSNFVPANNQLFSAQLPGEHSLEGTIEGHWSRANTPAGFINRLVSDATVALVLMLDQSTNFASFSADLSDFDISVAIEGAETVDFTATFKSNGTITYA